LSLSTTDLVHLRRARDLIDRDYAAPLDVPAMARAAHASPSHFARQYKEAFGESPYQHLLTRRVERAKALLRAGELSVTEVCLAVGFQSLGSFSARFHEIVGETPSTYRDVVGDQPRVPGCVARAMTRPAARQAVGAEKRRLLPEGSRNAQSRVP
jgi:AraC-like DNA-binding protein